MKKILPLLLFLLAMPLMVHAEAPETLDMAGLNDILQKNRDKAVMLNFFATWCPPCRVEIPELVKLRDSGPDSEFVIIGLSVDENREAVEPFIKEAGVNFPVYMAPREITDKYGVTSVPHNVFIGKDGAVIYSEPGMADVSVLKKVIHELTGK